jgi:uncharacterized RDD family membrane protein YckC
LPEPTQPAESRRAERQGVETASAVATPPDLPLFTPESNIDRSPPVANPRPARPPLAVRRSTPEVPRRRTPHRTRRADPDDLGLQLEPASAQPVAPDLQGAVPMPVETAGSRVARLFAAVVDTLILGGLNYVILYLTLAIAGLSFDDVRIIRPVPMGAFLLLLNGGYLIAFTVAGGQTIGKMLTGIRVVADDGARIDTTGAVFRAVGIAVALGTLGLAYLPAFFSANGKALHDRLAGTRVVKA